MRRLSIRASILLMQYSYKLRLAFVVIGIFLMFYFYSSGIKRPTVLNSTESFIKTQEHTEYNIHHFEIKQEENDIHDGNNDNQQQTEQRKLHNITKKEVKLIDDVKQDVLRENEEKERTQNEETFSPSAFPYTVNMTGILRQYDLTGFAVEQPRNRFGFTYIENPDHICRSSKKITVLFIIKSSPGNTLRRETIRKTWANTKRFPSIRILFSFGKPKNNTRLKSLLVESSAYKDILIVKDYIDNYYNLTMKTLSGLKWVVTHCAHAQYVVSADDDMYVAPDLLLRYLNSPLVQKVDKLYSGHRFRDTKPIRNPSDKWMVSLSEYPFKDYPDYIFGGFVIMSMSTVRTFNVAAMFTKILKFEDVYLGILAAKVGIEVKHNGYVDSKKTFTVSESFKTVIASHFYNNPKDLQRAWDCHLSILDQNDDKAIFCDYIGKRLQKLKSEIDNIVGWMEDVKFNS